MVVLQNQYIFAKKCYLHWIADRANIICKYITYTFFQFWAWLLRFLFYVISKSFSLLWKKKLNNFCCIVILFVWTRKSVFKIFKILFQTEDINIFVLLGVFFSIYLRLKSSFLDETNISGEIWDTLIKNLSKIRVAKY